MEAMIHQFPVERLSKDEGSQTFHDQRSSPAPLRETLHETHFDTVDVCTTQLWLPAQFESWNGFPDWSHDDSIIANEAWPYQHQTQTQAWSGATNFWTPSLTEGRTNSSGSVDSPFFESVSFNGGLNAGTEQLSPSQTSPPVKTQQMYLSESNHRSQTKVQDLNVSHYDPDVQNQNKLLESDWMGFSPRVPRTSQPVSETKPSITSLTTVSPSIAPEWPSYNQIVPEIRFVSNDTTVSIFKRKHESPGPPPSKKSRQAKPQAKLSEYVGVFENEPGALTTVKKRKKLDVVVRKAAQDVRKAGACHQCRFRKRTCSTGTPCTSCLKNGRGLHDLKCQRESPFTGKAIHPYFEHSSNKRFLTFQVTLPAKSLRSSDLCWVTVDGIGKLSHTIRLRAYARSLDNFSLDDRAAIEKTKTTNKSTAQIEESETILLLDIDDKTGIEIEQWAVEYASKFVHAAGPKFYPTTAAVILATAYLKKGLPESELMAAMLRAASIAFVLRAGVKYTTSKAKSSSQYRTIQASIDTILYQRLKVAEKDLYKMLQRIVFRSLGYISREQIYPVALVFWQLLRMLSLSSSHLSNISERFKSIPSEHASFQYHALKLVLSTHFALFRSSNPLLLDYNDKPNQDLLGGDEELIDLAMKMRKVVLDFRAKGVTDMKGSIAYRKEHFDLFRKVYDGL